MQGKTRTFEDALTDHQRECLVRQYLADSRDKILKGKGTPTDEAIVALARELDRIDEIEPVPGPNFDLTGGVSAETMRRMQEDYERTFRVSRDPWVRRRQLLRRQFSEWWCAHQFGDIEERQMIEEDVRNGVLPEPQFFH